MKIEIFEMRKVIAEEGMILTNGTDYNEDGKVYLGVNDNPNNWYEIPVEEYEEIQKANELPESEV